MLLVYKSVYHYQCNKKKKIYIIHRQIPTSVLYCHILFTVYSVDRERDKVISHGMEMNSPSGERQEEAASVIYSNRAIRESTLIYRKICHKKYTQLAYSFLNM